jgi:hypothetical protein
MASHQVGASNTTFNMHLVLFQLLWLDLLALHKRLI